MRMGRRQIGNPLRRPEIKSGGNRGASGPPTAAGQTAAAAPDAGAAAGQPPLAKTLSTNAGTRGDSEMRKRAVEMAEWWKAWKSKSRISPLPTAPWKSRKSREIPTFPQLRRRGGGKVENQKQVSHFPTAFSWVKRRTKSKPADCVSEEKGDTSIEVRKGTFLTRLDRTIRALDTRTKMSHTSIDRRWEEPAHPSFCQARWIS